MDRAPNTAAWPPWNEAAFSHTQWCTRPLRPVDSHRGFQFHAYRPNAPHTDKHALRATRGRITLFVEVSDGELPSGWHLRDVLRHEINRLMDPATLRHVDHLN
ncbi:hypothetical protein SRM_01040 [Salinibacter ruber M8]|mgnify:FL=1|jgi:hypothetical protein|uniref:Uncharacterized protein n=1 Tax=Salinibacter ruber (strain M8) TaxID=761659 RepID=D5H7F6_SALRM|nr:hypothetical protein SRM_01040 [Salinibacter ruber M8]